MVFVSSSHLVILSVYGFVKLVTSVISGHHFFVILPEITGTLSEEIPSTTFSMCYVTN